MAEDFKRKIWRMRCSLGLRKDIITWEDQEVQHMCRTVGMPRKDMKGPSLSRWANLDFVCKQGLR